MSYCRWSTDDFSCDLYCYEDSSGGFTTHVAGNRVVFRSELPPEIEDCPQTDDKEKIKVWAEKYVERHNRVLGMVRDADHVNIGLPHDGASFNDETIEDFLVRLQELKAVGYKFPDSVIEAVKAEIEEKENGADPLP